MQSVHMNLENLLIPYVGKYIDIYIYIYIINGYITVTRSCSNKIYT